LYSQVSQTVWSGEKKACAGRGPPLTIIIPAREKGKKREHKKGLGPKESVTKRRWQFKEWGSHCNWSLGPERAKNMNLGFSKVCRKKGVNDRPTEEGVFKRGRKGGISAPHFMEGMGCKNEKEHEVKTGEGGWKGSEKKNEIGPNTFGSKEVYSPKRWNFDVISCAGKKTGEVAPRGKRNWDPAMGTGAIERAAPLAWRKQKYGRERSFSKESVSKDRNKERKIWQAPHEIKKKRSQQTF